MCVCVCVCVCVQIEIAELQHQDGNTQEAKKLLECVYKEATHTLGPGSQEVCVCMRSYFELFGKWLGVKKLTASVGK